jgi:hypothetical protein
MAKEVEFRHGEPISVDLPVKHLSDDEMKRTRLSFAARNYVGGTNTVQQSWTVPGAADVPTFPEIFLGTDSAKIVFRNETFSRVDLRAAEMLQAILANAPLPLGLTAVFGQHPERSLEKLPQELFARLESQPGNKGYLFIP